MGHQICINQRITCNTHAITHSVGFGITCSSRLVETSPITSEPPMSPQHSSPSSRNKVLEEPLCSRSAPARNPEYWHVDLLENRVIERCVWTNLQKTPITMQMSFQSRRHGYPSHLADAAAPSKPCQHPPRSQRQTTSKFHLDRETHNDHWVLRPDVICGSPTTKYWW